MKNQLPTMDPRAFLCLFIVMLGLARAAAAPPARSPAQPDAAKTWCRQGADALDTGDGLEAVGDYTRAVTLDPKSTAALCGLAAAKGRIGDYPGASADYHLALKLDPRCPAALAGLAAVQQDRPKATPVPRSSVTPAPGVDFDAKYSLTYDNANPARRRGGWASADTFTRAAALEATERTSPRAVAHRAAILLMQGDYKGALADLDWAVQVAPRDAELLADRGYAKSRLDDFAGALNDYNEALALAPKDASAYARRGWIKELQGDPAGALADYDRAVDADPKQAPVYSQRARLEQLQGKLEPANADYNRAIDLDPTSAVAYNDRATGEYILGQWTDAWADYRTACDHLPKEQQDYPRLFILLIRQRLGEGAAAGQDFAAYVAARGPARVDDWFSKVSAYTLGKLPEADLLAAAPSDDPLKDRGQHCEAWFYLGMKKRFAGDRTGAAEAFRQSLATGSKTYTEYAFAAAELKALAP